MKTTLVLLLSALALWVQAAGEPVFSPPPTAVAATNRPDLEQALQRALSPNTNIIVNTAATTGTAATSGPAAAGTNASSRRIPLRPIGGSRTNMLPPLRSDSIVVPNIPSSAATNAAGTNVSAGPGVIARPGGLTGAGTNAQGEVVIRPPTPAVTNAPEETIPAGTINFPATDLNQVLQIYAELVGRTVLRPTTLPAPTITLRTQTPLTRREAKEAFDAVLALNGISMIDIGDKFVKAVADSAAGTAGAAWNKQQPGEMADLGSYMTHVVQLKYAKPSEVVQALQPFAKIPSAILPIDSSQILVLRDYTENVKRMLEMVREIDVAVPAEFVSEVIPIKYALAGDIANALSSIGGSGGGGGTTVGGGNRAGAGMGGMGSRFGGGFGGGMNRGMGFGGSYGGGYGSYGGGYGSYGGGYYPQSASITPLSGSATPQSFEVTPQATFGTPAAAGTTQPGVGSSFNQRLQNIINRASKENEIQVIGQNKIIADERTNSLLVFASRQDMETIKDIISKLDVVLAQVLIEAIVMEVSLDNSRNLGVSYLQKSLQPGGASYFQGIGAVNNGNFLGRSAFGALTNGSPLVPSGFSYLAQFGNDLDVTLTAIANDSRINVLSRPRIQTSHAVMASLFIGNTVPYITGTSFGAYGAYGQTSIYQPMQVGITLNVLPLINPDGLVVMDISQDISQLGTPVTIDGNPVPTTTTRSATAKVAVKDRDTVMLGGFISNTKSTTRAGVPILKDIPGLGYLFRSTSDSNQRVELIVLMRPTVLPTPEAAAAVATAERNNLGGVRRAERENRIEEAKRIRQAEKEEQAQGQR